MKIKVIGDIAEGKSTISHHIQKILREAGFDVSIIDEELSLEWFIDNDKRMKALKGKALKIEIETFQVRRQNGI